MIKITLEFESETEANRWLNQHPYTAPPQIAAGPVTKDEAHRARHVWNDPNVQPDGAWTAALTDFLERRGVSTDPVEFSDEQIMRAIKAWFEDGECVDGDPVSGEYHRRMRAALHAAGAKP